MLEELKQRIKQDGIKIIGPRIRDGVCVFCGEPVGSNGFCFCKKAERINLKVKKLSVLLEQFCFFLDDTEFKKEMRQKIINANFPKKFAGMDFEDYIVETEENAQNLKIAQEYAVNGLEHYLNGDNLIFVGNFGNAKTMLLSIIGDLIVRRYFIQVAYINFYDFSEKIKNSIDKKGVSTGEIIKKFKTPQMLMLDDIDKVNPSPFMVEIMYGLVNYRSDNQLPTCLTANHSLEELSDKFYGEAIISRFYDNSIKAKFTGPNWRLRG